jgi:hypothetical protein
VSTLLHAIVYVFLHNLLNALVQIANKMRLQNKLCQKCLDGLMEIGLRKSCLTQGEI